MTSDSKTALEVLAQASREGAQVATEPDGKALLNAFGIAVPPGRVVSSYDEAAQAAEAVGWPVAIKVVAPDLPHKSDVGGVVGPVHTPEELSAAAARVSRPDAVGLLVERWEQDGIGCFVGLNLTGPFGPTVSFGLGGVWVETLRDVSHRLAPIDEREALEMVHALHAAPILDGARGRQPTDLAALTAAIARISTVVTDSQARRVINEIDINPLLARACGPPVALDATVTLRHSTAPS